STASRSSETVPPPAASEGAPHRACPSSAAVRSWHESGPHRPTHNSQLRQQIHQPVTVAGGFHADQRRRRYLPVEPFRVARGLDQLLLSGLSRLRVQPTHLLPAGVKITSYNHHVRRLLSFREALVLKPRLPDSIEPSLLSNQSLSLLVLERQGGAVHPNGLSAGPSRAVPFFELSIGTRFPPYPRRRKCNDESCSSPT